MSGEKRRSYEDTCEGAAWEIEDEITTFSKRTDIAADDMHYMLRGIESHAKKLRQAVRR